MRSIAQRVIPMILGSLVFLAGITPCHALTPGTQASLFSLQDLNGKKYDLSSMKNNPMMVIYFFDAKSRPSLEGLQTLDQLVKNQKGSALNVWAVTRSPRAEVAGVLAKSAPSFPILLDTANVSEFYDAKSILPVSCITGPNLKVIDYFQGGGKTMNTMLVRLAERKLQQRDTGLARSISEQVTARSPGNETAAAVKGYALLREGKTREAEAVFSALARGKGTAEITGKEGLAVVYSQKKQYDKAMTLARELQKKAPSRAYPYVIEGDILSGQNKRQEAKTKYETALKKSVASPTQKAVAYNKLGRLKASVRDYEGSRALYDKAIEFDPYYVEAMANKGVSYEKEGKWDQALAAYEQGKAMGPDDSFTNMLVTRAVERIEYLKDPALREQVDSRVKDLAASYRAPGGEKKKKRPEPWTSTPLVICLGDFTETGSCTDRDGASAVLAMQLADGLKSSGRVKLVDRMIFDRLLDELNMDSSALADSQTSLKLGRVFSARVMGVAAVYTLPEGSQLRLKLFDTGTASVIRIITAPLPSGTLRSEDVLQVDRQVLEALVKEYPLRAFVVDVENGQAIINLGASQGVVVGTAFNTLGEQEEEGVEYEGKTLKAASTAVNGRIEVVKTEDELSYCRIVSQKKWIDKDDKVIEITSAAP
jgi:tetratricopeptide (TPR) repeat protein